MVLEHVMLAQCGEEISDPREGDVYLNTIPFFQARRT